MNETKTSKYMQTFIPLYWVGVLLQTQELGSIMVTVMAVSSAVATFWGGRLADQFGFKCVIKYSFIALVPLILIMLATQNVLLATLIIIPFAASISIGQSPSVVLGQAYLPERIGLASGITLGVYASVGGICSPLLGRVGDLFGLSTAFYIVAGVSCIGLIASFFIKEPEKQQLL